MSQPETLPSFGVADAQALIRPLRRPVFPIGHREVHGYLSHARSSGTAAP
jgi:hypothetical protein